MKKKTKVIKAWAVLYKQEGEIGLVNDVGYYIFSEDTKIYAKKFAEARNKYCGRSCTKVIPVKILL